MTRMMNFNAEASIRSVTSTYTGKKGKKSDLSSISMQSSSMCKCGVICTWKGIQCSSAWASGSSLPEACKEAQRLGKQKCGNEADECHVYSWVPC